MKQAVQFLSNCQDSQFYQLVKDRHIFSFKNGIYFANKDEFLTYQSGDIPTNITSSKYFPLEFETDYDSWESIDIPYFDSIFKH